MISMENALAYFTLTLVTKNKGFYNVDSSFSGYYTDNNLYNPTKKEFLIFCLREGARDFIQVTLP